MSQVTSPEQEVRMSEERIRIQSNGEYLPGTVSGSAQTSGQANGHGDRQEDDPWRDEGGEG